MNDSSPGASGLGSCYVETVFAAQVAIQISGAVAQAGSPDNFDLAIVQETGIPAGQTPSSTTSNKAPIPVTGPLQPATVKNSETTGAVNTQLQVNVTGVAGQTVYLYGLAVRATGGTPVCQVIVDDVFTAVWTSDENFVSTSTRTITWTTPLAITVGHTLQIFVTACGAGVTSVLDVQASQL